MNSNLKMRALAMAELEIGKEMQSKVRVGGVFHYELEHADGTVEKWSSHNIVTDEGIQYLLAEVFGVAAKVSTWYVGLYTAISGAIGNLKGSDIGGAVTEFTAYTGNRKAYSGLRSGLMWTNAASKAEFAISSAATIKGAFLASDDAGAALYLLTLDAFTAGDRSISPSDTLKITYEFAMAGV